MLFSVHLTAVVFTRLLHKRQSKNAAAGASRTANYSYLDTLTY